jgi:hypothetical protein
VTASISFRQRPATVHRATCYRVAVDYTARRGRTAGVAEQLSNAERGLPERVAAVLCWLEARFFSCLHQLTCNTTQRYLQPPFVVPMCVSGCTVHNNLVLVLRLYGVHTTCECSGAVEHGHNGGLCIVLTCSWRVANFGSPTFGTRTRARILMHVHERPQAPSPERVVPMHGHIHARGRAPALSLPRQFQHLHGDCVCQVWRAQVQEQVVVAWCCDFFMIISQLGESTRRSSQPIRNQGAGHGS